MQWSDWIPERLQRLGWQLLLRAHTPTDETLHDLVARHPSAARAVLRDEHLQARQEADLLTPALQCHEEVAHEVLENEELCRRYHKWDPAFLHHILVAEHGSVARRVLDDPDLRSMETPSGESLAYLAATYHLEAALDVMVDPELQKLSGPVGLSIVEHALMAHEASIAPRIATLLEEGSRDRAQQVLVAIAQHAPTYLAALIEESRWVEVCEPSFFAPLLAQISSGEVRQTLLLAIQRCKQPDPDQQDRLPQQDPAASPEQRPPSAPGPPPADRPSKQSTTTGALERQSSSTQR